MKLSFLLLLAACSNTAELEAQIDDLQKQLTELKNADEDTGVGLDDSEEEDTNEDGDDSDDTAGDSDSGSGTIDSTSTDDVYTDYPSIINCETLAFSEIYWIPLDDSEDLWMNTDWFEIYNQPDEENEECNVAVNISGWVLEYEIEDNYIKEYVFEENTSIELGGYKAFEISPETTGFPIYSTGSLVLYNQYGNETLRMGPDEYSELLPGNSKARVFDTEDPCFMYYTSSPTPNAANIINEPTCEDEADECEIDC